MSAELVNAIRTRIIKDFALYPVVAMEIEFYLKGAKDYPHLEDMLKEMQAALLASGIATHPIEKERGVDQYEIALQPLKDPALVAVQLNQLKQIVSDVAKHHGIEADFSAKPFAGQPGSGLHVHLHLMTGKGDNVFFKEDDSYSETLLCALGGLLLAMKESMPLFAATRKAYARFVPGYNVPVTVSWGANNRTVAIRLPTKPAENKHLEHRVAGADADPMLVMAAILAGIHHGILHRVSPGEQIFGDASLPIYALEPLPRDIKKALACMQQAQVLPFYFGKNFCVGYAKELLKAA